MSLEPVILEGSYIRLVPLTMEHEEALCAVGLEPDLWQFTTIRLQTPADMRRYMQAALQAQAEGTALPFVILDKLSGQVIGTTRYHSIHAAHRRLEIGFTWIALDRQRTGVNIEAKYLLLLHAFETCRYARVEFKADVSNLRSLCALQRIGATQEGVLRQYMLSEHKGRRDIALFSILATEWPAVKAALEIRLSQGAVAAGSE